MNDYKELIEHLRNGGGGHFGLKMCYEAADAIEQLVKERDAAVADLQEATLRDVGECFACKHRNEVGCSAYSDGECWEWRGVKGVKHE